MRTLVCGGRDFFDYPFMIKELDRYPITTIIQGGAKGADALAKRYANETELLMSEYPAAWGAFGKAAGFIRNKEMLDKGKPDLVICFPGGKGTEMMFKLAVKAGIRTIKYLDKFTKEEYNDL